MNYADRYRYLLEIGDKSNALNLVNIAMSTCSNKETIIYGHLSNTSASIYFAMNHLKHARSDQETSLRIRKHLDSEEEYSNSLHNMGNICSAEGHLDEALKYFMEAKDYRGKMEEESPAGIAITLLGIGRIHAFNGDYTEARLNYESAENIILRKFGANGQFMAEYVHRYKMRHSNLLTIHKCPLYVR